jgi:hypothetical protein
MRPPGSSKEEKKSREKKPRAEKKQTKYLNDDAFSSWRVKKNDDRDDDADNPDPLIEHRRPEHPFDSPGCSSPWLPWAAVKKGNAMNVSRPENDLNQCDEEQSNREENAGVDVSINQYAGTNSPGASVHMPHNSGLSLESGGHSQKYVIDVEEAEENEFQCGAKKRRVEEVDDGEDSIDDVDDDIVYDDKFEDDDDYVDLPKKRPKKSAKRDRSPKKWTCSKCTFINESAGGKCSMCQS